MKELTQKYFRPTPLHWRIAGDLALLMIPAVQTTIAQAPNLSETVKYWINEPLCWALIAFKFLTNLAVAK